MPNDHITRRTACAALAAVPISLAATEARATSAVSDDEPVVEVHEMKELSAQQTESGEAYLPFLKRDSMNLGVYQLPKDGVDGQTPHELDEIYYVTEGKAIIEVDGEEYPCAKGSVIFVAAGADHRFKKIEEALTLLVFFSRKRPE